MTDARARRIDLFSLRTPAMRNFHLAWSSFFVCFFAWFALAPLMGMVSVDLALTPSQLADCYMASVAATVIARLIVGWLSDRFGPRRVYGWLLLVCAVPVMAVGLAHDYQSFLLLRLAIGVVGASFVVTQYHTSAMFAPNCVGLANATTAGWGNTGGGVANMAMPLVVAALIAVGVESAGAWRWAMVVPGTLMLIMGALYLRFGTDTPTGERLASGAGAKSGALAAFKQACRDPRVWVLFVAYGACFGVELAIHNFAASYYASQFKLDARSAGLAAGSFGVLALFARSLGGWMGDRAGREAGLAGRTRFLGLVLLGEALALALFAVMDQLWLAIPAMLVFGLCVHMAAGATYAVIPLVRPRAVGAVSGIVGAGGNVAAVACGLLFKQAGLGYSTIFLCLAAAVGVVALVPLLLPFRDGEQAGAATPVAAEPRSSHGALAAVSR